MAPKSLIKRGQNQRGQQNENFDNADEVSAYMKKIKEANNRFYDSPSDAQFLLPSEWMLKV